MIEATVRIFSVNILVILLASLLAHDENSLSADEIEQKVALENPHPIVAGYQRFFDLEKESSSQGGNLLLGELNCLSCHASEGLPLQIITTKQAPLLGDVGSRVRPAYLRDFLADPQATKSGTTMPDLFASHSQLEKREFIEPLVHFLTSQGTLLEAKPDRKMIREGGRIFHQVGCVACHGSQEEQVLPIKTSVPLGNLAAKYTLPGLQKFLRDPLKVRPSGRMPHPHLKNEEIQAVAHYLLRDLQVNLPPNLRYAYYEGSWEKLPDFSKLTPKARGIVAGFDLSVAERGEHFGIVFEGFLHIAQEGEYRFLLTSDDGSKLIIDGKVVVDNDGLHGPTPRRGTIRLSTGAHAIRTEHFNSGAGAELSVEFSGPGLGRQDVSVALSLNREITDPTNKVRKSENNPSEEFVLDQDLAQKGSKIFSEIGCSSCHQLKIDEKLVSSNFAAPGLRKLNPNRGCLKKNPGRGTADFSLSEKQRASLKVALRALSNPKVRPLSANERIDHTLTTFNCYACHERDKKGGVEEARNQYFSTTQKEMGDEGRIPPHLSGVGAKLTSAWFREIFSKGADDRPYMHTRMPRFGIQNVGRLEKDFALVDSVDPIEEIKLKSTARRVKSEGRFMVGSKAFGCVKCHNFKNIRATGIQSLDMTKMTKRLRRDWFHHYLINPAAYRPSTRMPSAWPNGLVLLPKVLDGTASGQIEAIWRYLADGDRASVPQGLGREPIELIAADEAILYRNFIQGAGTRAIGVGYPEKANLAFDANQMRLALIWQGSFMDASKHWIGRGSGFQPPLGDNVMSLPEGPSLAILSKKDQPWPLAESKKLGFKFRGYRLSKDRRPTFLYDFNDVRIEDFPNAQADEKFPSLLRSLTFQSEGSVENLWFRAAVAESIEEQSDGVFLIDNDWKIQLDTNSRPVVRPSGRMKELIVPVKFNNNRAKLTQHYIW